MKPILASLVVVVSGVAACSSPTPTSGGGGTTINGTLGGRALVPTSAIALKGVYDSSYPGIVTIIMADVPNLCAVYQQLGASGHKANLFEFGFTIGETTSTSTVVPGTYGAGAHEIDSAGWDSYDATCNATHSPAFSAATITVTAVGASYSGSFDVSLDGGDHVTGTFEAPLCVLPDADAGTTAGDGGTCVP